MPKKKEPKTLLKKIDKLERMIEAIKAQNEIEGNIETGESNETVMFSVNRQVTNITGDPVDLLTKTRFDDNIDVGRTLEPLVQRVYHQLQNTRYGGDSILLPLEEIEAGEIDLRRYAQYQFWKYPETIEGKKYVRCFIDMNSIRTDMILHGRFASQKGKARIEDIHKSGAIREGQGYIDAHAPAPPVFSQGGYNEKKNKKVEAATDAILEPVDKP